MVIEAIFNQNRFEIGNRNILILIFSPANFFDKFLANQHLYSMVDAFHL